MTYIAAAQKVSRLAKDQRVSLPFIIEDFLSGVEVDKVALRQQINSFFLELTR